MPEDLQALHDQARLRSFLTVPVMAGGHVAAALTVAAAEAEAFSGPWWQPTVTMAATALLPHMLSPHVSARSVAAVSVRCGAEQLHGQHLVKHGSSTCKGAGAGAMLCALP